MEMWLETFLDEKRIQYTVYDVKVGDKIHIMDLDAVMALIYQATPQEQEMIKRQLVLIDSLNGDVHHYFKHLIKAYIKNTKQLQ